MRMFALAAALLLAVPAMAQDSVELSADAQDAFFRGVGLLEGGDPAAALSAFEEAASIQPDFRRVYYYRARALIDLGRRDEAITSLDAYEVFDLPEAEADQARALREQLEGPSEPPPPPPDPEPVDPVDPAGDVDAELDAAQDALDDERCGDALAAAQRAMRLDPGQVEAFLLKGLALECAGELTRARGVLVTYLELAPDPDPSAAAALDRLRGPKTTPQPVEPEKPKKREPETLGSDPRIAGVLDQRWGSKEPRRGRTVLIPQVGAARYKSTRMRLAGDTAEGEQLALWHKGKLVWARFRIDGGGDSNWFGRAFKDLLQQVSQDSGDPDSVKKEGSPGEALDGRARYEAVWTDKDGDRLRLRLGRCARRDTNAAVLPESAPCLELTGSSGSWTPAKVALEGEEARPTALVRTPGDRDFDFSVGVGGGGGFGFLIDRTYGSPSIAPEGGAELLVRFNIGAFAVGAAWHPSVSGYAGSLNLGPFFESRVSFYVGLRGGNREPKSTDVLFGVGFLPQVDSFGLPTAAPTLSLRIIDNYRRAPMGLAWVSFEPWVMIGPSEIRFVPMRFTVGGAVSTKARLRGKQPVDGPWGPLFDAQ